MTYYIFLNTVYILFYSIMDFPQMSVYFSFTLFCPQPDLHLNFALHDKWR